jgi:hypothetical protein
MATQYTLLTSGTSSPKLAHMNGLALETAVLYLAPANSIPGINVCAAASPFCKTLCLYESGRMEFDTHGIIRACRIRRTELFRDNQPEFMRQLVRDVSKLQTRAQRNDKQPACRLNGTSDILWEHIPVTADGIEYRNIMLAFPMVQFYDYTKIPARIAAVTQVRLPANYHITFSLSESNDRLATRALEAGINVAVPMHIRKHNPPVEWSGYPVIDGDLHDYRFTDPQGGYIIALSPKGRAAKRDTASGFIRNVSDTLDTTRTPTFAA